MLNSNRYKMDNSHSSILKLLNTDDREYLEKYIVRGGNYPGFAAISAAFERTTSCEEPSGALFAMLIKMEEEEDDDVNFRDLIYQQLHSMVCNTHA